jgi:hypothetical protein
MRKSLFTVGERANASGDNKSRSNVLWASKSAKAQLFYLRKLDRVRCGNPTTLTVIAPIIIPQPRRLFGVRLPGTPPPTHFLWHMPCCAGLTRRSTQLIYIIGVLLEECEVLLSVYTVVSRRTEEQYCAVGPESISG